ncbi:hypothetical protein ABZ519_01830 [Streptomyces collinus]
MRPHTLGLEDTPVRETWREPLTLWFDRSLTATTAEDLFIEE